MAATGSETPLFAEMWARERATVADQVAAGIAAHADGEDHRRPRGLATVGAAFVAGGGGGDWVHIETHLLGSTQATITFSDDFTAYRHLRLLAQGKSDIASPASDSILFRFNGDSTAANYVASAHYADNTSHLVFGSTTDAGVYVGDAPGSGTSVDASWACDLFVPNVNGTAFEQCVFGHARYRTGTYPIMITPNGSRTVQEAVTSLSLHFSTGGTNWIAGSTFSLYGIV